MKPVIVLLCAAAALAGPVERSKTCSRHCTDGRKLSYQPGTTYVYDYASTTETAVQGTTSQKVAVHIYGQVEIEPLGSCDFLLQVRGTTLEEEDPGQRRPSPNMAELRDVLERYPLRFSYQDGRVDNLCPAQGETPRALNIKKAILSLLQNSMKELEVSEDVTELDIAGRCPTIYETLPKGWSSMSVRRIKDLSQCKERESAITALQASSVDHDLRSAPVVKGRQECKQVFQNGLVDSVECKESHVVRPFSKSENGARTDVTQRLNLRSQRRSQARRPAYGSEIETDLLFDHDYDVQESSSSLQRAENALRAIADSAADAVQSSTPGLFTELVFSLRKLSTADLEALFRRAESMSPKAKKFFADSLPAAGSPAAIRMMTNAMISGQVTGVDADIWLTSLAFVSKPTSEMIEHALPLLKMERSQAYLGVSTMAYTYCRNNANCGSERPIKELVRALYLTLGENCYARDDHTTLMVLKALGNLGQSEGAEDVLYRCFQNPQLDIEIRLAAVQAFRRFDCDIPRNQMLSIYQNVHENVELRIASYLAAIRCPSSPVIDAVKETLRAESIKQVGSFVYSHIRNLAREHTAYQPEYRVIANDLSLRKRFQLDFRKFSRNVHYRMFFDPLDTGFELDGDVVYTPDSYYPRSARVATSFDIFGKRVDLFEAGARAVHLEKVIEQWMPSDKSEARAKRTITDNSIDELDRRFAIKSKYSGKPKASAYVKFFGNEIASLQLTDAGRAYSELAQWLSEPTGVDLSKSVLFADSTLTVPASSGLPLRVSVNGSATVALKVGGNSQFRKGSIDITGLIKPSGAVQLAMLMSVDAHKSTSGVRMVATMSSSWSVDGSLQMQQGQAIKARLNMPEKKMELIDVKSKIFLVNGGSELEHRNEPQKKLETEACTGATLESTLGLRLCGRAEFPVSSQTYRSPMYPFSGNAELSLNLLKVDPTLTAYEFESSWTNSKDLVGAVLSMNTPGTKTDREITASLQHNLRDGSVALKMKAPSKKLAIEGRYNFDEKLKKLNLQAQADDEAFFQLITELKADAPSGHDGMKKYTHVTDVTYRGEKMVLINGQWVAVQGRKYSGNVNIEKLTQQPVEMKMDLDLSDKRRVRYEGSVRSFFVNGAVSGYTQTGDNWSTKADGEFSLMGGRLEKVGLTAKFRDLSSGSLAKYSGAASFQNTFHPALNTELLWDCQKTDGQLENTLQILRGGKKSAIKLQQIARYTGTLANNNAGLSLKLAYPQKRIDWQLEMKHENTPNSLLNRMQIMYAPSRQISTVIDISTSPDTKADLQLSYPGREMRIGANYRRGAEHRGEAFVQWNSDKKIEVSGTFKPGYERRQYNPSFQAEIRIPNKRPVTVSGSLMASRGHYSLKASSQCSRGKYELDGTYRFPNAYSHNVQLSVNTPQDSYSATGSVNAASEKTTANVNMKLGRYREVVATAELAASRQSKSFSVECQWDATRDASRRASVKAEVIRVPGGYNANFAVKCPKQDIRGSVATTIEGTADVGVPLRVNSRGELEWMPRRKITYVTSLDWNPDNRRRALKADAQITTPFYGTDKIGFLLTHNDDGREWNSEAKMTLPRNRIVTFSTDGLFQSDRARRNMQMTAKLQTPDNSKYSFEAAHGATHYDTNNKISLRWAEDKVLSAEASGAYGRGLLKAKAEALTPIAGYERLTASLEHTHTSEGIKCQAVAQWSSYKRITFDVDGQVNRNGEQGSFDGKLRIATPFKGAEQLTSQLSFSNDARKTIAEFEGARNRDKIAGGFMMSLIKSRYDEAREIKMHLTSPVYGYENLEASGSYSADQEKFNAVFAARLPYSKNVSVRSQGRIASIHDFASLLHIQLPVRDYERINIEVSHAATSRNVKSTGHMTIGPKKFTLEASGDYAFGRGSHEITAQMLITTPIRDYQQITIDLKQTRSGLNYDTSFQCTSSSSSLSISHRLMIRDINNFEQNLEVSTPFSVLPMLNIRNKHRIQRSTAYHSSEMEWQNRKRLSLIIDASASQSNYANEAEAKIELYSPWRTLGSASVNAKYSSNSQEIAPRLNVEWNRSNYISVEGTLRTRGYLTAEGKLALTSTIRPLQAITLSTKYDIANEQKSGEMSVQWGPRPENIVSLTVTGSHRPRRADIDVALTSPVRGYERIQLTGNMATNGRGINGMLSLATQRTKKYELTAELKNTHFGSAIEITLSAPIRGLERQKLYGEYNLHSNKITSKFSAEWQGKSIHAESEVSQTERETKADVIINTPFQAVKNIQVSVSGSSLPNLKTISCTVQLDNKNFELNGLLDASSPSVKLEFRSPIERMEFLEFNSNLQQGSRNINGNISFRWSPDSIIILKTELMAPLSYNVVLLTPFEGYRHLSLNTFFDLAQENKRVNIVLEKENQKISLTGSVIYNEREFQINIHLTTPIKPLEFLKISGDLKLNGIRDLKGILTLQSPSSVFGDVKMLVEYQKLHQLERLLLSASAADSKYDISATRSFNVNAMTEASLQTEYSHFGRTRSILNINIKAEGLKAVTGSFLLSHNGRDHAFALNLKNHGPYEGSIEIKCPNLPGSRASLSYVVNAPTKYFADFKVTGEYALKTHAIEGSFESKLSHIETQLSLNSPSIRQEPVAARLLLSSPSSDSVRGVLSLGSNTVSAELNWDHRMAKGKMDIDSNYLRGRTLKAEGVITTSRQGADLSITLENARKTHLLSGSWKRVPGSTDAQLRIESPLLSAKTLTGNFNYRNDFRSGRIESSLIVSTQRQNFNTFVAISARDLSAMEGNVKIETPFEVLRFADVNARYSNVQNRAVDWSLGMKSSVSWLRDIDISGKVRRQEGSVEATVQGRLPTNMLSNFESTFVCTHNEDFTTMSPRLSIQLPGITYTSEAKIQLYPGNYYLSASHEWEPRRKIQATLTVKKSHGAFGVQAALSTPFRNLESIEAGMACGREGGKRTFKATYKGPRNELYELQHAHSYHGSLNFFFENTIVTPHDGLRSAHLKVQQQRSRSRLVTDIQCNLEAFKVALNVDHDPRNLKGSIMATSSAPQLRILQATYELSIYKVDGTVNYNDQQVLKVAGAAEYVKSLRAHRCELALNVPALQLAVEGGYKPVNSGREFSAKFNSARRTIQLQTLWQNHPYSLVHQMSLKWGQDRGEEFSYDVRSTRSARRDLINTDLSCKVNFPLRSFEVRASESRRKNLNNLSCELFWDAARDQSKHVTFTIEHQNLSSRSAWAHKMSASIKHPRLNKDITMRLEGSLSGEEVHGKTELEYSPDARHNVMLEGRIKKHGRSHLSAELIARQPVSLMDISTAAELKNGPDEASAQVTINYMNRNRQMRVQELKASIFKLRQAIDLLLRSGQDRNQLKGEMYDRGQEFGMTLQHQLNERPPTKTHVRVNKRHSNMEIVFMASDASSAKVSATASMDNREIRLSHTTLGRSVSDILIKLGLKEKRFLSSEISWRPELAREASNYALDQYGSMRNQLYDIWQSFSVETQQELRAKRSMIGRSLSTEVRPLLQDIARDWRELQFEVGRAAETLQELYHRDQFYLKTVVNTCSGVVLAAGQMIADSCRLIAAVGDYVMRYVSTWIACDKIADVMERFAESSRRTLIFTERLLVVFMNRAALALSDSTDYLVHKLEQLTNAAAEYVVNFCERYGPSTAGARELVDKVMEAISLYTNPLAQRIMKNAFVQGMWRYIERTMATLNEFNVDSVTRGYRYAYDTMSNAVGDVYEHVVYHPHVQYVSQVTNNAVRKIREVSDRLGVHDMAAAVIDMGAKQIQDSIVEGLTDAIREYSNLRSGLRYEFAPKRGLIVAEVRLPAQKESLAQAFDVTSYPEFDRLVAAKDRFYHLGANSFWDAYYQYSRAADPQAWVPPFKARALVAGSQHYRTFDGFHFEFAGECSYLLAKDFLNDNFAVVINYARDGQRVTKKSITVITGGGRFDISTDYKVTKAGNKIELPIQVGGTTIHRAGHVITVENDNGLKISCNLAYDQCVTEVTGDYFGKTGGLLGTYDYEDKLDLMTPDRKIVEDTTAFASEWEVGQGRCRNQRNLAQPAVTYPKATALCSKYFEKEESPLRSCFKMVDPKPYMKMCLHDMNAAIYSDDMESNVCFSAAAYREECRETGISLDMPRICVRCAKPDGAEMLAGDIATVTDQDSAAPTADVVFVVERKLCNKNVIPNLIRLAQGIEERYAARGFLDTRYAVVGFGGDGFYARPHVVTADGQIFSSIRALVSAFGSLTIGDGESDPLAAVAYAGQLPVRMASAQTMILVKCTTCKPDDDSSMYADIYRMLIDRGVHLHILDDDDFNVRTASKPSKSKRIFGVDYRLAFTVKDVKDMQGDAELHSQIRLPKDFCVPLALESNGTLFSSMKMFEKRNINKKFLDVMSRRVAISSAPDCQICECVSLDDGVGQSLCSRCVSPTLGPVRSPDFSPSMYEEAVERKTYKRPKTKKLRPQNLK
uniref:Microtubule associated complex n=1 Tax=Rhipicephalus appendiculatus TaxID=34631 RepID=A0A131YLK2_RHIAP